MDLIKKMFSIPPELPLSSTQRFTFVSAVVAYMIAGLSAILLPDLWSAVLYLDISGDGRGYFILTGSSLFDIGLGYVVLSRNKSSQIPNHSALLGTVLSRLLVVNVVLTGFYTQGIISTRFALLFCVLDSTLSVLTYVIWSREDGDASLLKFFRDIWSTVKPCYQRPTPYAIFQVLGFVQFIASFIVPSILISMGIVSSSIQGSHAEGLLRSFFFTLAVHAVLHILAAGSQNSSFPLVSVFYRLMWNIPVFFLLGITSQITRVLANILIIYDVIFIIVTIVLFTELFTRDNRVKAN